MLLLFAYGVILFLIITGMDNECAKAHSGALVRSLATYFCFV